MPFNMQTQEEDNWCWAAVAVSVDHYFFPQAASTQCQLAGKVLGRSDCCSGTEACDKAAYLEAGLAALNRPPVIQPPLAFDDVRQRIDAGRPVCVRIQWGAEPRGHFVAITGYQLLASGEQMVEISDPFYDDSTVDFAEFTTDYQGAGQWTASFLV